MVAMNLHAHITDSTTGETRVHHFFDADIGLVEFDWADGNNACDCNRSLHFSRAGGGDGWSEKADCGESRFVVRILNDAGTTVYEDDAIATV
jgi:hypothetical protein